MENILFKIAEAKKSGRKAALCIIVQTTGSSPRKAGAKMIVYQDASFDGTIGGGSLEFQVVKDAIYVISNAEPQKFNYDLNDDLSMNCGGKAEVYIEPIIPNANLYIFGAGHVGSALAKFAMDFGFHITLIDHRKDILEKANIQGAKLVQDEFVKAAKSLTFSTNDYIVIVTPKHAYDEEVLAVCGKKPFTYLGMIGSKSKVALARKRLIEEKILTSGELDKVDMPIGVKFNAQTPEEIAISILAKLIDVKNSSKEG